MEALHDCVTNWILETQLGETYCEGDFQLQIPYVCLLQSVFTLWLADKLSLAVTETIYVNIQPCSGSHYRAVAEHTNRTVPQEHT